MSDFGGFDDASVSALETDLFDGGFDLDGLEVDNFSTEFPDPIDGADAADFMADGFDVTGDSVVDSVLDEDLIVVSDGTSYGSYAEFVPGVSPAEPSG